jgi:hypothetical protein
MKLEASQASLAFKMKDIKLKVLNTNENIKFNKKCLEYGVIPKYISIKTSIKTFAAKRAKEMAEKYWLRLEIKSQYAKKNMLNKLLLKTHLDLLNKLHPSQQTNTIQQIDFQVNKKIQVKKRTQSKKLNDLVDAQIKKDIIKCNHKFHPSVVNKTNIDFDDEEINLLNKGLNFNFARGTKNSLISELLHSEAAIRTVKDDNARISARVIVSNKAKNVANNLHAKHKLTAVHSSLRRVATRIRDKLTENEAIICKADKGSSIVILPKSDYVNKVFDFFRANEIVKLDNDPTLRFSKDINKQINSSKNLLSSADMKLHKVTNPQPPILRGLPKIHKPDIPIRPLVNFIPSPGYKIAKKLDTIIRREFKFHNNNSLKNSYDLVNKISDTQLRDSYLLASFDVVNLYTNIPVDETLKILKENLSSNSSLSQAAIVELINLTRTVLKQNYFKFEDEVFSQNDGLAMGSPLSSILAEIFLNHVENKYLWSENNRLKNKIVFYHRYVDDTIVLFDGTKRQLKMLGSFLNNLHKNLKFTLEEENNKSLNFLDLTISRTADKLQFKIYRKPTTSSQTIHNESHHPQSHKLAAYHSFVSRLLAIPMSDNDYKEEINTIKYIAVSNGYKSKMVDKLIYQHQNKNKTPSMISEKINFTSTEYGTSLNNVLKKELSKNDVKLSFRTSNKLSSLLKDKEKPSVDKTELTGVYKINCDTCPSFYIGQTARSFKARFKEHLPKKSAQKQNSAFAEHLTTNNHSYTSIENNLEVLQIHKNRGRYLNVIEEFEIYKAGKKQPQHILNEKASFESNLLYQSAIDIESIITKRKGSDKNCGRGRGVEVEQDGSGDSLDS